METAKKTKRSVLRRERKEALKEAARKGAAKSRLRNVPTSPRKMRLVADLIRGERVSKALSILKYQPQHSAATLEKLLLTAISDWGAKNTGVKLEEADLFVKTLTVEAGRALKRLRPAPQGRAYRVRKRSNHITLVVDSMQKEESAKETKQETKE